MNRFGCIPLNTQKNILNYIELSLHLFFGLLSDLVFDCIRFEILGIMNMISTYLSKFTFFIFELFILDFFFLNIMWFMKFLMKKWCINFFFFFIWWLVFGNVSSIQKMKKKHHFLKFIPSSTDFLSKRWCT